MATQLAATTKSAAAQLERDGIVILPGLVPAEQLGQMQRAFQARLHRMRWNDVEGYEQTEFYRHMVQNALTLDQGFVDLALHPVVKATLAEYIGSSYRLAEIKGWLSLPTHADFNGWHGDAWYDQSRVGFIPREVKLGLYLTDVRSGAFNYLKGTQGKQPPRYVPNREADGYRREQLVEVVGPAGTAFLFDTTGIHRQAVPILEPRHAVFYCYHDTTLPLQRSDIAYNRYHPLLLNAAFLGGMDDEDRRILGFGDKTSFVPAFSRAAKHEAFQAFMAAAYLAKLRVDSGVGRVREAAADARRSLNVREGLMAGRHSPSSAGVPARSLEVSRSI